MFTLLIVVAFGTFLAAALWSRLDRMDPVMRAICGGFAGTCALSLGAFAVACMTLCSTTPTSVTVIHAQEIGFEQDEAEEQTQDADGQEADEKQSAADDVEQDDTKAELEADEFDSAGQSVAEAADEPASDGEEAPEVDPSVLAQAYVVNEDKRPTWVATQPVNAGTTSRITVTAGPHLRIQDCNDDLKEELKKAVDQFIDEHVQFEGASGKLNYSQQFIHTNLVSETYQEAVMSPSFGEMQQLHALIDIPEWFVNDVDARWHELVVTRRLASVGILSFGVLALVSVLFAYFRVDTATKGFYTGRLQFVTALAILALIAVGVLLGRSVPWM